MPELPGPHPANPAGFAPTGYVVEWGNASLFFGGAGSLAHGDHLFRGSRVGERFAAGDGADTIVAGGGDDRVKADGGQDRVDGGRGDDSLDGGSGDDRLSGDVGMDTLVGGSGQDRLFGEADADLLLGGADNDLLDGGAGDDTLIGGPGRDILVGGAGSDRFVFSAIADSSRFARDRIQDFEADDLIETPEGFHRFGGALPAGTGPADGVIYSREISSGTVLFGQLGAEQFMVTIQSTPPSALAAESFIFTFIA